MNTKREMKNTRKDNNNNNDNKNNKTIIKRITNF